MPKNSVRVRINDTNFEAELAEGFFQKLVGMRFRNDGKMLFKFRERKPVIDMLFVPTTLQLVFIDEEKHVVDLQEAKPWSFYRPESPAKYLLESTEALDLEEGDRLEFEI